MSRQILIVATALLAVTACTNAVGRMKADGPTQDYREYAGEPIERFTAFDIDGWHLVSRNQLVVWTGVNDAYLLTVWDSCDRLNFAERVAVTRTANSVSRLDSVIVQGQRCPINEIRAVDVKRMKADRAAMRATAEPKP
jgi:Family of unknown function (DUF6491)